MDKPEWTQLGIGLTAGLAGVGMQTVSDSEVQLAGIAIGLSGVLLMISALRSSLKFLWPVSRISATRRREVAGALGAYIEELRREAHEAVALHSYGLGPSSRYETRLNPWKAEVLEYLDANVSLDAAEKFHKLRVRGDGSPHTQLDKSCEVHAGFLLSLKERIEKGALDIKHKPQSSGSVLPVVRSFIYGDDAY